MRTPGRRTRVQPKICHGGEERRGWNTRAARDGMKHYDTRDVRHPCSLPLPAPTDSQPELNGLVHKAFDALQLGAGRDDELVAQKGCGERELHLDVREAARRQQPRSTYKTGDALLANARARTTAERQHVLLQRAAAFLDPAFRPILVRVRTPDARVPLDRVRRRADFNTGRDGDVFQHKPLAAATRGRPNAFVAKSLRPSSMAALRNGSDLTWSCVGRLSVVVSSSILLSSRAACGREFVRDRSTSPTPALIARSSAIMFWYVGGCVRM